MVAADARRSGGSRSALVWIAVVIGLIEGGLAATARRLYDRVLASLPWHESDAFTVASRAARRPNTDFRVAETWARQGLNRDGSLRPVFVERRWEVYQQELSQTLGMLALFIASQPRRGDVGFRGVAALTVTDLVVVGRQRRGDLGPIAPLVASKPRAGANLARRHDAPRTIDSLRNLPISAGAGNISAYRTLDLPSVESLTALAGKLPGEIPAELIRDAARDRRVDSHPRSDRTSRDLARELKWPESGRDVVDPTLAGWRFGKDWVAGQGEWASTFRIATFDDAPCGWLLPLTSENSRAVFGELSGNPLTITALLKSARPLNVIRYGPEQREIHVETTAPSLLILSELADPEWTRDARRKARLRPADPAGVRPVRTREPGRLSESRHQALGFSDYTIGGVMSGRDSLFLAWPSSRGSFWVGDSDEYEPAQRKAKRNDGRGDRRGVGLCVAGTVPYPGESSRSEDHRGDVARRMNHRAWMRCIRASRGRVDLVCSPFDADAIAERAGVAFLALPHTASLEVVPALRQRGVKVIDLCADYRLNRTSLRRLVWACAHRSRRAERGGLRPSRDLSRENPRRAADRESRLLHIDEHPRAGAVDRARQDRTSEHHHRREEWRFGRGSFAEADDPFPRMQRKPLRVQRRQTSAYAGDRSSFIRRRPRRAPWR